MRLYTHGSAYHTRGVAWLLYVLYFSQTGTGSVTRAVAWLMYVLYFSQMETGSVFVYTLIF